MKKSNIRYEAPRIIFIESVAEKCFCGSTVNGDSNERFTTGSDIAIF